MAISLYDLSVGCYLQTVGGVAGFLQRGLKHFTELGIEPDTIVQARLFADMAPLSFQIVSVAHHSMGAVEGLRQGLFHPPAATLPTDYAGLQKLVADTESELKTLTPEEVNGFEGKEVVFKLGEHQIPFTAENFVMSFSLPNFHFHSATAYDILRMNGVPLGKRNYMGALRTKQ